METAEGLLCVHGSQYEAIGQTTPGVLRKLFVVGVTSGAWRRSFLLRSLSPHSPVKVAPRLNANTVGASHRDVGSENKMAFFLSAAGALSSVNKSIPRLVPLFPWQMK